MAPGSLRPEAPEAPEPARSQCSGGDGGSPECAWRCSGMRTGRAAMETVHRPAWCRQTPSAGLEPSPTVAPGFLRVTGRFSRCCLLRRVRALRPAVDRLEVVVFLKECVCWSGCSLLKSRSINRPGRWNGKFALFQMPAAQWRRLADISIQRLIPTPHTHIQQVRAFKDRLRGGSSMQKKHSHL